MERREFQDLLTHMEWADAHAWRAVRSLPQALADERLKYLFHHIHLVQWVYLQAWNGDPFQLTELTAFSDLAAIETWAKPCYRGVAAFAERVDEPTLSRPVDFPWSALIAEKYGTVVPATLSESAWQVFSHTTYHRGQIAIRIRELGGEPPLVDFLVWVWSGKPAPEWAAL
jgi:uncharacterized damage-inducible protein DinB